MLGISLEICTSVEKNLWKTSRKVICGIAAAAAGIAKTVV
jgi:hypothetical protein